MRWQTKAEERDFKQNSDGNLYGFKDMKEFKGTCPLHKKEKTSVVASHIIQVHLTQLDSCSKMKE